MTDRMMIPRCSGASCDNLLPLEPGARLTPDNMWCDTCRAIQDLQETPHNFQCPECGGVEFRLGFTGELYTCTEDYEDNAIGFTSDYLHDNVEYAPYCVCESCGHEVNDFEIW